MSNARNLARISANTSGAIAATNLANAVPADGSITTAKLANGAVALGTKVSGVLPDANAPSGSIVNYQLNTDTSTYQANPGAYAWTTIPNYGGTYTMQNSANKLLINCQAHVVSQSNQGCVRFQYSLDGGSSWTTFNGVYTSAYSSYVHGQIFGQSSTLAHYIHVQNFALTPASATVSVRLQAVVDGGSDHSYNRTPNNIDQGASGASSVLFQEVTP